MRPGTKKTPRPSQIGGKNQATADLKKNHELDMPVHEAQDGEEAPPNLQSISRSPQGQ